MWRLAKESVAIALWLLALLAIVVLLESILAFVIYIWGGGSDNDFIAFPIIGFGLMALPYCLLVALLVVGYFVHRRKRTSEAGL